MDPIEVKIDRTTLPEDGQRVTWQKVGEDEEWKEGTFCEGDDIFCVGFEDSASKWDLSWDVIHWKPL
jgi:hypothetical protein